MYRNITIGEQTFTKLEISPDYEEKNQEFVEGLKEKGIRLTLIIKTNLLTKHTSINRLIKEDNLLEIYDKIHRWTIRKPL